MGANQLKPLTTANVCIVESLGFFDEDLRREGEIISRTLRLSGKRPYYSYVRSSEGSNYSDGARHVGLKSHLRAEVMAHESA
jgi:hypothetical protein